MREMENQMQCNKPINVIKSLNNDETLKNTIYALYYSTEECQMQWVEGHLIRIRFHGPFTTTTLHVAANRVIETVTTLK